MGAFQFLYCQGNSRTVKSGAGNLLELLKKFSNGFRLPPEDVQPNEDKKPVTQKGRKPFP